MGMPPKQRKSGLTDVLAGTRGALYPYAQRFDQWLDKTAMPAVQRYGGPHVAGGVRNVLGLMRGAAELTDAADVRDYQQGTSTALADVLQGKFNPDATAEGVGGLAGMFAGNSAAYTPMLKAIFAGVAAKTADKTALDTAKKLADSGADARQIWDQTGWFQGADGKWRFEISDKIAGYADPAADTRVASAMKHNDLYAAYPDVADIRHQSLDTQQLGASRGQYTADTDAISLNRSMGVGEKKSTLLHELQHAVQGREGFASGGSTANAPLTSNAIIQARIDEIDALLGRGGTIGFEEYDRLLKEKRALLNKAFEEQLSPYEAYRRLAGEVEARNVQTRMDMTSEQRRAAPPWETEDVPRAQQIVRHR